MVALFRRAWLPLDGAGWIFRPCRTPIYVPRTAISDVVPRFLAPSCHVDPAHDDELRAFI